MSEPVRTCPYHGDPLAMEFSGASKDFAACVKCDREGTRWYRPVEDWNSAYAWKELDAAKAHLAKYEASNAKLVEAFITLEKQVTSLELSKKLKALGVKQESVFCWEIEPDGSARVVFRTGDLIRSGVEYVSAFTVAELGEMLPGYDTVASRKLKCSWRSILYDFRGLNHYFTQDNTEADARAKMLCYLLEKNILEKKP